MAYVTNVKRSILLINPNLMPDPIPQHLLDLAKLYDEAMTNDTAWVGRMIREAIALKKEQQDEL